MGSSEVDISSKEGKDAKEPKTPLQEHTPAVSSMVAVDWSGFQAYSPMPPPGFWASSPQTHPYMWGLQQFIPPYGTPPHPYVAMYPHGGIYAHPTMALANSPSNMEVDGKSHEGKEKLPIKRSKGSLGSLNMITGKNSEPGKMSGASTNGLHSKSAESASDGSSEGSDAADSENELPGTSGDQQDSGEHNSQNGGLATPHPMVNQTMAGVPMLAAGAVGGVPGPTTNLNIGMESMDYWGAAPASAMPPMLGKVPVSSVVGGMVASGSQDNAQSQPWMQDERELKRQRRKQSNRESARRSRLRKQAECDELAQGAEALKEENASLRTELARIRNEYEQLLAQNASLKERLGELPDQEDPRRSQDDQQSGSNT